jgi:type IV pilus assembly protein PilC
MAGHTFSSEIKNEAFFPSLIVKMVQVGEKSGKIADMLKRSADYYTEEVERSIQDMTVLIEPMLIVLIGGVVLITVLALYLPIFNISTAVR